MPLSGSSNIYEEYLNITPGNATGIVVTWGIEGGEVISGQGTPSLIYKWNPVNGFPVTRSISVLAQNQCSRVTSSRSFVVCDPIVGVGICGPLFIAEETDVQYSLCFQSGSPLEVSFSIVNTPSVVAIDVGQDGDYDKIIRATLTDGFPSGDFLLVATFEDCDGNVMTATKNIQVQSSCIPISSISF